MKLTPDIQYPSSTHQDQWEKLKQFTDARIALGRAGCSLPTKVLLDFQLAHAQAQDAVYQKLDTHYLSEHLSKQFIESIHVESNAKDKQTYLKRPDLGRQLSEDSKERLVNKFSNKAEKYDVCIVVGDGLSARAIESNAISFILSLAKQIQQEDWALAPVIIATGSRVALGDDVAEILKAPMLVMLIGERPGLSSPDSMGVYYTWDAHTGSTDAQRNCISNVRTAGLSIPIATQRLIKLMKNSKQLGFSGVDLKDEHQVPNIQQTDSSQLLFKTNNDAIDSFPTLTSKRLILREITQTDIQQIFEIYSDTEAMRWFGTNPVQSSEQAQSIIELFANWRIQANPGTRWGIQLKGEDHLIGTCGLFRWDTNWKKCSVGYELVSSAWGNGYMFEALNTIIPWGFTEMMLNRIEALIHPKNVQSLRLIENLSFRNEGLLREAGYWSNQHHDLLQYGLLLSDWNTTKQH